MIHAEPNESASIAISPVLTRWLREHDNVRRLLMLIELLLEGVGAGDETELALLQDAVTYLNEYMDRLRHPMEDAALRRLGAKRTGETALPSAVAFAAGHGAIAESGSALLDDIVAAEADIPLFGGRVGDRYRALLFSLKSRAGCDCSLE